ncbi:reverse transcriptase domain-containing protein, partial [Tanacetum coccineum]
YAARITKIIADIEDRHHGPSDAMHNPPQPLRILKFINNGGKVKEMKKGTVKHEATIYTHGIFNSSKDRHFTTWISTRSASEKQTNPQGSARTTSAVDLEELCEKHYEKLLPIMADKYGGERKKSWRKTMSPRRQRLSRSPRHNPSVCTRLRRERSRLPRHEYKSKARREKNHSESEDSEGGNWKSKTRRKKSSVEDDDLSQPWVCAETDPFTSRIRYFDFPKTRMPSHVKTYNGSEDPEDHLKIFQATTKTERWAMPTWCHMFNSTLTGNARVWFDDLPPESIDNYNDLREAFLKNYLQQKKCIKDPVVLHKIKQRDGESTEDCIQTYKSVSGNVKGAP